MFPLLKDQNIICADGAVSYLHAASLEGTNDSDVVKWNKTYKAPSQQYYKCY